MKIVCIQGGLGNQMFQYAFYRALQVKYHVYVTYRRLVDHNGYELNKVFGIKMHELPFIFRVAMFSRKYSIPKLRKLAYSIHLFDYCQEPFGVYSPEVFTTKQLITLYDGYWQSEKYFQAIASEIRLAFQFPKLTEEKNLSLNTVSLHVRRGDYLTAQKTWATEKPMINYYNRAIKYISSKVVDPVFLVFSDDIPWCKSNLTAHFLPSHKHIFIDWNSTSLSYRDMQLMSLCKHNIISNSTFSWWGAWLNSNPNKIVISPENWYPGKQASEYADLIPTTWIKLRNS